VGTEKSQLRLAGRYYRQHSKITSKTLIIGGLALVLHFLKEQILPLATHLPIPKMSHTIFSTSFMFYILCQVIQFYNEIE